MMCAAACAARCDTRSVHAGLARARLALGSRSPLETAARAHSAGLQLALCELEQACLQAYSFTVPSAARRPKRAAEKRAALSIPATAGPRSVSSSGGALRSSANGSERSSSRPPPRPSSWPGSAGPPEAASEAASGQATSTARRGRRSPAPQSRGAELRGGTLRTAPCAVWPSGAGCARTARGSGVWLCSTASGSTRRRATRAPCPPHAAARQQHAQPSVPSTPRVHTLASFRPTASHPSSDYLAGSRHGARAARGSPSMLSHTDRASRGPWIRHLNKQIFCSGA